MIKLTPRKKLFVDTAADMFGDGATINKEMARQAAENANIPYPTWFKRCKVGYNMFKLPSEGVSTPVATTAPAVTEEHAVVNLIASNMEKQNLIPTLFEGFVPWGNYGNLKKIIKSNLF